MLKLFLFLHIISAIFWIGGMLFLVFVIAPFLKTITDPQAKANIFQIMGKQFRTWGWLAIVTLLTTGPLLLYKLYGLSPEMYFTKSVHESGFGKTLAIKIALVTIVVISSFLHDFWIGPRARSSKGYSGVARLFGRANLILALLIVIFAVFLRAGGL